MRRRLKKLTVDEIVKIAFYYAGIIAAAGFYQDYINHKKLQHSNNIWAIFTILNIAIIVYLLYLREKKRKSGLKEQAD